MRILIITYSYFPALTPRAFRWTTLAESLAVAGHEVEVVCAANSTSFTTDNLNGVRIHRTGGGTRERLKRWLGRESPSGAAAAEKKNASSSAVRSHIGILLKRIYANTLQKVLWPDFSGFWYFSAAAATRIAVKQRRPDVVVSVSLPFTGHLVGLAIKRRYGVRWVVDIGDPFTFMNETPVNNHKLFSRLNRWTESKVLQNADYVAVTTQATKDEYLKWFPEIEGRKISVIPPLFVEPVDLEKIPPFFVGPPKIRLLFAGTLYGKIRNPATLLDLFSALLATSIGERLELHFLGAINDCESYFEKYSELIGKQIILHGLVQRTTAMRAMKDATVLVNLGNSTAYQLPSKVVEYVMLGKPVLNIAKQGSDSSQNFFFEMNGICTVTEQVLAQGEAELGRIRDFVENPPIFAPGDVERLASIHGLEAVVKSYVALFQECATLNSGVA